jgi:hypothetical protein
MKLGELVANGSVKGDDVRQACRQLFGSDPAALDVVNRQLAPYSLKSLPSYEELPQMVRETVYAALLGCDVAEPAPAAAVPPVQP